VLVEVAVKRLVWLLVLLPAVALATLDIQVESGVAMPWRGYLQQSGEERTEVFDRGLFRAYLQATLGYTIEDVHNIEIQVSSFSLESSPASYVAASSEEYVSSFGQQTIRLRYRYVLPPLERFSLRLGLQGNLFLKSLSLTGSREYTNKWSDLSVGPAAEIRFSLNEIVSLAFEVEAGLGKGNGFLDLFAGLNFDGPFYYFRAGTRYAMTSSSSETALLSVSFWHFGAQFRASF
jgi:hypothetical protein